MSNVVRGKSRRRRSGESPVNHKFVSVLAILLTAMSSPISVAEAADRPNVLFIAIDDLNDWIGCLNGHPQALTPNIDRLAARGILFENAHCVAPACRPSRAALFSGQLPKKTGVWSNDSKSLLAQQPDLVLLPHALKRAGYATLGTGKLLHHGTVNLCEQKFGTEQRWSPLTRAAVEYTTEELSTKGSDRPRHVVRVPGRDPIVLPLNGAPSDRSPNKPSGESMDWGPFDVPDSDMGDAKITNWAIDRLQEQSDKPFFLGVGYYRPHIPLWAPKSYFERFVGKDMILPPFRDDDLSDLSDLAQQWALEPVTAGSHATVQRYGQWRDAVMAYLACVTFVDHHVGRLIDALDAGEFDDNTLVVLWSDHGWHLGEKQHWGKWTGWERSTRVPLMIVPPKNRAHEFADAGSRCEEPVSLIDLYPTIMELCGADAPDRLDGTSLVPQLRQPDQKTDRAVITTFDPGNISVRTSRWRYIRYADGSEELYDHDADPNEWTNLANSSAHRTTIADLRRRNRFQLSP